MLNVIRSTLLARAWVGLALMIGSSMAGAAQPAAEDRAAFARLQARALEHGEGVTRDPVRAAKLYCDAARDGDAESQFSLGWMYANGRGVERDDQAAAYFFHAAAEQGVPQAKAMLEQVGARTDFVPECMRPPPPAPAIYVNGTGAQPIQPPVPVVAPKAIEKIVAKMAPQFRIEPQLVLAIIKQESNFDTAALSPKNAMGLMQLIPETAERFNVKNPYDATQNIRGGMSYLRWLLAYFEGDIALVAAAYNAGEGTVERYKGVPPYKETKNYVDRILGMMGKTMHPFDKKITSPSPRLSSIRSQPTTPAVSLAPVVRSGHGG